MKRVDAQVEDKIQRLQKIPAKPTHASPTMMTGDPWQVQLSNALTPTPIDAAWNLVKKTLFGKAKKERDDDEGDYQFVEGTTDDTIPIEDKTGSSGLVNRRAPNNWNTLL